MITIDGGRGALAGAVTLDNVGAVLEEGNRVFTAPVVTVDLSGITEVDSTAVSVLLEWRRAALRDKRVIEYVNFPANLRSLIELYGMDELLAVQ